MEQKRRCCKMADCQMCQALKKTTRVIWWFLSYGQKLDFFFPILFWHFVRPSAALFGIRNDGTPSKHILIPHFHFSKWVPLHKYYKLSYSNTILMVFLFQLDFNRVIRIINCDLIGFVLLVFLGWFFLPNDAEKTNKSSNRRSVIHHYILFHCEQPKASENCKHSNPSCLFLSPF